MTAFEDIQNRIKQVEATQNKRPTHLAVSNVEFIRLVDEVRGVIGGNHHLDHIPAFIQVAGVEVFPDEALD